MQLKLPKSQENSFSLLNQLGF